MLAGNDKVLFQNGEPRFDERIGTFRLRAAALGMEMDAARDSGQLRMRQVEPTELSPGEFASQVVRSVENDKCSLVIIDSNPSLFTPYSGTGWAMYEGMYISLKPASGKFTTTLDSFGGWTCAPGGAHFADTFTSYFKPDGGVTNMWPPTGSMFSSISGIVGLTFGGGVLPIDPSDFTP